MTESEIDTLGERLASARRRGVCLSDTACDLRVIRSPDQAEAVGRAAELAYGAGRLGWSLAGTSESGRRQLGCSRPIVGPLLSEDWLASGSSLGVRASMLGIGAQLAFTFGRSYPSADEPIGPDTIPDALATCRLSLQVLGRRVAGRIPLDDLSATADFGLSDTEVPGPLVDGWRDAVLDEAPVEMSMDGHVCTTVRGRDMLHGALASLVWLARHREARGAVIEAGDVVATGTPACLVQLTPGHRVSASWGEGARVELHLV